MSDVLLSEAELAPLEDELRRRADAVKDEYYVLTPEDADYATALRRYLLFSEWTEILPRKLSEEVTFYNTYYWYLMSIRLYCAKHGPDAGMEQGGHHLLTEVPFDLDWTIIEAIDKLVPPKLQTRSGADY